MMADPVLLVLLAGGAAVALGALARVSLARIEDDPAVRARLGAPFLMLGLWPAVSVALLIGGPLEAGFAGLALTAAWIDRQTAWVPEAVFIPALIGAGVSAASAFMATATMPRGSGRSNALMVSSSSSTI